MTFEERVELTQEAIERAVVSISRENPRGDGREPVVCAGRPDEHLKSHLCVTVVIPGGGNGYAAEDIHRMHTAAVRIAFERGFGVCSVVVAV